MTNQVRAALGRWGTWIEDNQVVHQLINELMDWKEGALEMLVAYEEIAESCGGEIGSRKIENLRNELNRLREIERNGQS